MKMLIAALMLTAFAVPEAQANQAKSKAYHAAKKACLEGDAALKGKALQRCIKKERARSSH
ncbi:MAG: hypothetical protein EOP11_09815 [Proteobacteria bacterium]|nr:MAG: hypothetical protein EOP11_09815 [Pseudomonadota bacterium]